VFSEKVFKALQTRQKKGLVIDWGKWADVLEFYCPETDVNAG